MNLHQLDSLDVHPDAVKKLKNAGLKKLKDVAAHSSAELQKKTRLAASQIENIQGQACKILYPIIPSTALDRLNLATDKIPTGCDSIDKLLGGGFLCQSVTEITGESGAGKTQICIQLALTNQLPREGNKRLNSLYICTEDVFPTQRLLQMEHATRKRHPHMSRHRFMDHIFIEHLSDKDQLLATLENRVPRLLDGGQTNLIILDSVTAVFRGQDECLNMISRSKEIASIGLCLHRLAVRYRICVVCINQVTADMRLGSLETWQPALGLTWSNLINTRLQVKRQNQESLLRTMSVCFAPHLPASSCGYTITHEGVASVL
ncbi:DNA repair protein XRCC3-like isoform X1 [Watersipora subatra]|uniref:DNA repair protein XRCC3-like isoform X1 n=1 Tax=Watersipora subatra TaxID=2589382 RepID=UPI00355C21D4